MCNSDMHVRTNVHMMNAVYYLNIKIKIASFSLLKMVLLQLVIQICVTLTFNMKEATKV